MLVKGLRRLLVVLGPLLAVLIFVVGFYDERLLGSFRGWRRNGFTVNRNGQRSRSIQKAISVTAANDSIHNDIKESHHVVFSASTADKAYFPIEFGGREALNPNIIPHPVLNDTWIIVAQLQRSSIEDSVWCAELVCNAVFKNDGTLGCTEPPLILPIAATWGDKCKGSVDYLSFNVGPHDARVFYGPTNPYAIFGSNSVFTCFGQWIQDFRVLVDWGFEFFRKEEFRHATELQRPAPWGQVEKNWFLFWDHQGQMYAHYDVAPSRVFAKLEFDGSIGQDLAPYAAGSDAICMAKYMPPVATEFESIHQATNSLSITLCPRSDPLCEPDNSNTFIMTIFQHKSYYKFHPAYEPYVMLFKQTAPFEIQGVSRKPIWINGRPGGDRPRDPAMITDGPSSEPQDGQPGDKFFYVTSLSWKSSGQKYHGHVDDVLFIGFGIEDSETAGIDVVAGDLLVDLGLC